MDAKSVAATIVDAAKLHAKSASPGSANISSDFCTLWPKAEPVLAMIAGIVVYFPGAGATAAAVLQGLIKVGNDVSGEICNS